MKKTKTALGLVGGLGISNEEQLTLIAKNGFDGYFLSHGDISELKRLKAHGDTLGLELGSIHAPFLHIDKLWHPPESASNAENELISCVHTCAELEVPIMVSHVFIGFDRHEPNLSGISAFERIAHEAEKCGVQIAFENTEGEEYLEAVMVHLRHTPNVGFCYDTGHAICYNPNTDMLSHYGDRLIYTHINDNLGVSDAAGNITWLDDLHLLPFDGVLEVEKCMSGIAKTGFEGTLSFELSVKSKPGRSENDRYAEMGAEKYIAEAFLRADRVREIFDREKQKIIRNRT